MSKYILRIICSAFLLLSLSGCGIIDYFYLPPPEDTAQELFESGNDAVREKQYSKAIDYYSRLRDNFPFSPYYVESELNIADCYYRSEEWIPAAEAYKEFEAMHPRHDATPFVLYYVGMSNLNSYASVDRATAPVEEAYSYFSRLRESFPGNEYAELAKEPMEKCRRLLAEHELYVGDFYFRMEKYGAAWLRYKKIIESYSDVDDVYKYAQEKSKAAYLLKGQSDTEAQRRDRENTWHNWFNWL